MKNILLSVFLKYTACGCAYSSVARRIVVNMFERSQKCAVSLTTSMFSTLQDIVKVVVEGEAEGSVTALQTQTLFLQMPSQPLVEADVTVLLTALKQVYTMSGRSMH